MSLVDEKLELAHAGIDVTFTKDDVMALANFNNQLWRTLENLGITPDRFEYHGGVRVMQFNGQFFLTFDQLDEWVSLVSRLIAKHPVDIQRLLNQAAC